jgi:hypothetical protein
MNVNLSYSFLGPSREMKDIFKRFRSTIAIALLQELNKLISKNEKKGTSSSFISKLSLGR